MLLPNYSIIFKILRYFIVLIFFIPFQVNAQNDFEIPDSLVRNSAAFYTNWVSIYKKMDESKSFKNQMALNQVLKIQFDSAKICRKKYFNSLKFTILSSFVPVVGYIFFGNKLDPIPSSTLATTSVIPFFINIVDRRNRRFLMSEFVRHVYNSAKESGIEIKYYNWDVKNFNTLEYIKFHENEIYLKNKFKSELFADKNNGTAEERVEKLLNLKKNGLISEKEFKKQVKNILNKN